MKMFDPNIYLNMKNIIFTAFLGFAFASLNAQNRCITPSSASCNFGGAVAALQILQSSNEAENEKSERDDFSYAYGVLIGESLRQQGVDPSKVNMEDLVDGLLTSLEGEETAMTKEQCQAIVKQHAQAIQQEKAKAAKAEEDKFFAKNGKKKGIVTTASGIQYEILKEGNGAIPVASNKVTTHYHGTLLDGTVFDSSVNRGQPASFGVGGVIKGWQEILQIMPTGSKWIVFIPAHLAYGPRGTGGIPPNSPLIFEIELISIDS